MRKSAFAGFLVALSGSPVFAGTCALCREALRSGGSPMLIKGFYWSIILIVTVPLVFLAIGVSYAARRYRVPKAAAALD